MVGGKEESGSEESTALNVLGLSVKAFPSFYFSQDSVVRLCFYCTWYRDSLEQSLFDVRALPSCKLPKAAARTFLISVLRTSLSVWYIVDFLEVLIG